MHDLELALEAFVLCRIAYGHFVRDLQDDLLSAEQVIGTINIAHPPLSNVLPDLEMVKLVTNLEHLAFLFGSHAAQHG
jgi:hypothetical protein